MNEIDKTDALKILGLDEKATQSEIEQAYKKLLAFYNATDETGSLSALAKAMSKQIDASYKALKTAASSSTSISGASTDRRPDLRFSGPT